MIRLLNSLKTLTIFGMCFVLIAVSIQIMLYSDPPGLKFQSFADMFSFPVGCIGIATAVGLIMWRALRTNR